MLTKQDTLIICSSNKSNQQGGAGVGVGEYETQVSSTAVGSDFRGHASYKSAPSYELKGNQVHKQQDDDYLDSWDENTLRLERCEAESIMDEEMGQLSPIPFSELPNLTNIGLCSYGIVKLSSNIRLLASATCVQICCNELSSIPAEIGYLRNLTLLDLSKNNLTSLPETITNLTKLVDLKLSYNQLEYIPAGIGGLTKLAALSLDNNKLESIPHQIGLIKGLVNLDLSDNPITVLPAEIGKLQFLRRLKLDRCPLVEEFSHSPLHSPPTLLELAARVIVRHDIPVPPMMVPHLKEYISSAGTCSFCDGPYFDSWVKRGKMIEKNEATIPLEYTLCQPHWNTEQERIKLLFCKRPITSPPLKKPASATTSQQGKGDSTLGGGNTAQSSSDASSTNSPNRPLNRKYLSESGVRQRPPPSSIAGRFSFLRNRSNSSSSSSNSNSNNGNGGSSSGQRPTSTYRTYSMPTIASTSTTSTSTPTRARALTSAPSPLSGSVFSSSSSSPITASASVSATNSGDHHISLYEMDSNHTYNSNSNNENNGSRLNSRRSVTASILARASFKLKRPLSMGAALLEPAVTSMGIAGPAPAE
ncbi:hypothetical protein BGZ46_006397 [Entomortierella lignicola]|nr:hypothetical protein BGZ46_006397 [Entomortierella lignicola]